MIVANQNLSPSISVEKIEKVATHKKIKRRISGFDHLNDKVQSREAQAEALGKMKETLLKCGDVAEFARHSHTTSFKQLPMKVRSRQIKIRQDNVNGVSQENWLSKKTITPPPELYQMTSVGLHHQASGLGISKKGRLTTPLAPPQKSPISSAYRLESAATTNRNANMSNKEDLSNADLSAVTNNENDNNSSVMIGSRQTQRQTSNQMQSKFYDELSQKQI